MSDYNCYKCHCKLEFKDADINDMSVKGWNHPTDWFEKVKSNGSL